MGERPVRVLWLIKGLGPGGAERLLVNHAAIADASAVTYEAAYLVPHKDHLVRELEGLGVPTQLLGRGGQWRLRWAWELRSRLAVRPVDVVHAHSPYPASIARLVVRTLPARCRPVVVSTEHNRWPRHHRLTRLANHLTFRLDTATVAVSEGVRQSIPASLRPRVEVVVQGIDVEAISAHRNARQSVRSELGVEADDVLVVIVANLRREKAYPDLMAAARLVLDAGAPAKFVAVGQGPLEVELRRLHDRLGLGEAFRFLGYRQDAARVVAGADLFTLSSRHEGLPLALMEALALGVPVVATAVGGIPEIVDDGREGVLVPAARPDLLATAIIEAVGDPERRQRMATAAAAKGASLAVEPAVRRMEAIYRSIARPQHPGTTPG